MIKSRGAAAVAPQSFHGARRCGYETSARPRYQGLPPEDLPRAESLRDCLARVAPCFADRIRPDIEAGLTVVVVAHGNSLRGLVKAIEGLDDDVIERVGIPNGIPLVYEFERAAGGALVPAAGPRGKRRVGGAATRTRDVASAASGRCRVGGIAKRKHRRRPMSPR